MDVFAHALWSYLYSQFANLKLKKNKLKAWLTVCFGVMPDVLSFAVLFIFLIGGLISGNPNITHMKHVQDSEPALPNGNFVVNWTSTLYTATHSMIIFFICFGLVWLILKRPVLEMTAWLLHILMDIPTHSYKFYPTPFLWPISGYKYDGIVWGTPWFMVLNYSLILCFYLILRYKTKKTAQVKRKTIVRS